MADEIAFTLTGAESTVRRLREFPPKLQRKALRRSARAAMRIVQKAARANAKRIDDPETGPQIWREIRIQTGRMREPGVMMRVGVAGGAKSAKSKSPPWYWRLVELGTENTRAQPFMRPALENNAQAVADTFVRETNAEIDKLVAGR